ncbi:XPG domain containing-domain-containing protein [Aspergillus aurantiobrunneus]
MGIPRLKRHLLPFCQTVLLQDGTDPDHEDIECIKSIVIDGPSLVYSVHTRLLSWFSATSSNMIDALPTCDEVSRGVIVYLTHLKMLGVAIERIYFDGALPTRKHETRVARLENQRKKLELFCAETKNGFELSKNCSYKRAIKPENVLRSRPISAMYSNIPANPFMVSAVFEDLKYRWNGANITSVTGHDLSLHSVDRESFPWADLTTMVPGEADAYCASVAKLVDSCILTGDSDLVLYDLGKYGSVIFLDSVELTGWDCPQPMVSQIKAAILRPFLAAQRLGVSNLLLFAYELKTQPEVGLVELLRRSKNATVEAEVSDYQQFAEEYQNNHYCMQTQTTKQPLEFLDTRISELLWQYNLWGEYATSRDYPHVYLSILNEDHTKQCAWTKGREYRIAAYSILNLSRPVNERHQYVTEFIRCGQRVTEDKIKLQDERWILVQVKSLKARLELLQISLETGNDSVHFWAVFALCHCYGADVRFTQGDLQKLKQFLKRGYMGHRLNWLDIHLTAQIHAVLYSLRVLKQLLVLANPRDNVMMELRATLEGLPPLHMMSTASQCAELGNRDITVTQLSDTFESLVQKRQLHRAKPTNQPAKYELRHRKLVAKTKQNDVNGAVLSRKTMSNIYDLLQDQ